METAVRKIDKLGRIVLPMDFRKALGLEGEAEVVIGIKGNTITVKGTKTLCLACGSAKNVSKHFKICSDCIMKIKSDNFR
ncbi:MAG: AbrB family transcriptional regulator [Clostridia bacterium]|nr:AbrB family transcriptional regulator [Clostridia bacterium]